MPLADDKVAHIKSMTRDELVANAQSDDMASAVEATLRLHEATKFLSWIVIVLTAVLVVLTAMLVWDAFKIKI